MDDEKELMIVVMEAAVNLIQTYNSGLSVRTIKTRMQRIAMDLMYAVES